MINSNFIKIVRFLLKNLAQNYFLPFLYMFGKENSEYPEPETRIIKSMVIIQSSNSSPLSYLEFSGISMSFGGNSKISRENQNTKGKFRYKE